MSKVLRYTRNVSTSQIWYVLGKIEQANFPKGVSEIKSWDYPTSIYQIKHKIIVANMIPRFPFENIFV